MIVKIKNSRGIILCTAGVMLIQLAVATQPTTTSGLSLKRRLAGGIKPCSYRSNQKPPAPKKGQKPQYGGSRGHRKFKHDKRKGGPHTSRNRIVHQTAPPRVTKHKPTQSSQPTRPLRSASQGWTWNSVPKAIATAFTSVLVATGMFGGHYLLNTADFEIGTDVVVVTSNDNVTTSDIGGKPQGSTDFQSVVTEIEPTATGNQEGNDLVSHIAATNPEYSDWGFDVYTNLPNHGVSTYPQVDCIGEELPTDAVAVNYRTNDNWSVHLWLRDDCKHSKDTPEQMVNYFRVPIEKVTQKIVSLWGKFHWDPAEKQDQMYDEVTLTLQGIENVDEQFPKMQYRIRIEMLPGDYQPEKEQNNPERIKYAKLCDERRVNLPWRTEDP